MAFGYLLFSLVLNLIAYAIMPKPQTENPKPSTDIKVPSIQEGQEIPVVFGTMEISPFVGWFGHLRTRAIRAESGGKK